MRALERVGGAGRDHRSTRRGWRRRAACCCPASAPSRRPARPCAAAWRRRSARPCDAGAWLLGICVGFQILFEAGEEFGAIDGLGLLPGRVTRLPASVPVPHIGWNRLHGVADHPLLDGLAGRRYVYFVHSYAPEGVPDELCLARCTHGRAFAAPWPAADG